MSKKVIIDGVEYTIPKDYVLIEDPIISKKKEKDKIKKELQDQLDIMTEPTNDELSAYGIEFHPYYEILKKIEELD